MDIETETGARAFPAWLRTVLIGRKPGRTLWRIAILVITCTVLFGFILLPIRVEGISMYPTYQDHAINFVNRLSYLFHEPRRCDVVAIRTTTRRVMYMKRIIGMPGETVEFHDGHAFIDGKLLEEPYLRNRCNWEMPARVLGPHEYFFVGDNRTMSLVDHYMGKADRSHILGRVLL